MTKNEYLKELETKLKEVNANNISDILSKYEKRWDFSTEAGINDDEILDMLGTPDEVAAKYANKIEEKYEYHEEEAKYKKGYNLIVKTLSDDVIIKVSPDDKNHVLFEDIDKDNYEIKTDTETGIYIAYRKSKFLSLNRRKSGKITISIPQNKVFDRIELSSTSGDEEIIDLRAKEVRLQMTSGDSEIHLIEADEVTVNTVSGDFEIYKINAKNVTLNTVSGDIDVDYITAGMTNIDSVSGDITVNKLEGDFKSSSVAGDVRVNNEECSNIAKKIKKAFKG